MKDKNNISCHQTTVQQKDIWAACRGILVNSDFLSMRTANASLFKIDRLLHSNKDLMLC